MGARTRLDGPPLDARLRRERDGSRAQASHSALRRSRQKREERSARAPVSERSKARPSTLRRLRTHLQQAGRRLQRHHLQGVVSNAAAANQTAVTLLKHCLGMVSAEHVAAGRDARVALHVFPAVVAFAHVRCAPLTGSAKARSGLSSAHEVCSFLCSFNALSLRRAPAPPTADATSLRVRVARSAARARYAEVRRYESTRGR